MAYVGWLFVGAILGAIAAAGLRGKLGGLSFRRPSTSGSTSTIWWLLTSHFDPTPLAELTISERDFPYRVRADLQKTVEKIFGEDVKLMFFTGVRKEYAHEAIGITDCLIQDQNYPTLATPPEYEEIDIGEEESVRAPKKGLWLLEQSGCRFAVMMSPNERYG
jgi:cell division protease FtsH